MDCKKGQAGKPGSCNKTFYVVELRLPLKTYKSIVLKVLELVVQVSPAEGDLYFESKIWTSVEEGKEKEGRDKKDTCSLDGEEGRKGHYYHGFLFRQRKD